MSLTTITDPLEILKFHFGESIFAMSAGIVGDGRLADFGSGAGFPGAPLALAKPSLDVTLVETNLKKSVFLLEVKRELDLKNVHVVRSRIEDLEGSTFDFVVSRAFGPSREILRSASMHLTGSGKVVLWLGDQDATEIMARVKEWRWLNLVRIPGSKQRCIISGETAPE